MSRINALIKEFCPNGVVFKTVGDVCNVYTGGETPTDLIKEKVPRDDYIYPVYSNGIGNNAIYGYAKTYRIKDDAVTFSSIGTLGHPEIRKGKFTPIIRLKVLVPIDLKQLSIRYLKYALETAEFDNNKSSLPNLNANMLKNIVIPIPPFEVQEEIVRILDKFGGLEAELEAELEERKSQYEFWRGRLFKQDIDKMVTLEAIGDVTKLAGFEFSEYVNYSDDGNIIALRGLNVKNGHLVLDDVKYVDNSDFSKLNRSKLYENDILYTYVGTVGQVGLVDKNDKYYLAPNVARIRIFDEKVNPKYVMHYLLTNEFKTNQLDALSGTSSMKNITMTNIRKFKIPVPSLEKQNRIVNILDKFDKLVNDMTVGLPAEIELRRKQYEYYRNKLLSFEELSVSE